MKGLIAGAAVFCAALIGLAVFFATRENAPSARIIPVNAQYEQRVANEAWVKGNTVDTNVVVIEEYGDLQCPGCAALHPVLQESLRLTADYTQFKYRHFPLSFHNKARLAARATESIGRQGKFWESVDYLYGNQPEWSNMTTGQFQKYMEEYAQSLGLNMEQYRADMKDNSVDAEINKDISKGNQVPLTQTPTLFINGEMVRNIPTTVEGMVALINAAYGGEPAAEAE